MIRILGLWRRRCRCAKVQKKRPRDFSRALQSFALKTALVLRLGCGGGGRFFAFDYSRRSRWLGQYDFAYYNSIAHV